MRLKQLDIQRLPHVTSKLHYQSINLHKVLHFVLYGSHINTKQRKESLTNVNKFTSDLDHVLTWKELPDGTRLTGYNFDEFMLNIAKSGEQFEERVGGIEGQLRARAKRSTKAV